MCRFPQIDYSSAILAAKQSQWKDLTAILDQMEIKDIEAYLDDRKGKLVLKQEAQVLQTSITEKMVFVKPPKNMPQLQEVNGEVPCHGCPELFKIKPCDPISCHKLTLWLIGEPWK